MGIRGELFTADVRVKNRTYFFNVKENRMGDIFLQIVETKSLESSDFERRTVVVFEDDMRKFLQAFDASLSFIERERKARQRERAERREAPRPQGERPPRDRDRQRGGYKKGGGMPSKGAKGGRVRVIARKDNAGGQKPIAK